MSKIIAINAGSSSLKFQLFEMPNEEVITKGLIERIGLSDSVFNITVNGEKQTEITDIPNHEVAVELLLSKLTSLGIIKSLEEIEGVGHRVRSARDVSRLIWSPVFEATKQDASEATRPDSATQPPTSPDAWRRRGRRRSRRNGATLGRGAAAPRCDARHRAADADRAAGLYRRIAQ